MAMTDEVDPPSFAPLDSEAVQLGSRACFPDLAPDAFLNHAAISPPSRPVQRAITKAVTDYARHGVGAVMPWVAQRERLRGKLVEMIGAAEPAEVGLVKTTSDGVVAIAQSLDWQPGDRVVLFRGEFPTNTTPWQQAAKQYDVEVVWLDADAMVTEEGIAALGTVLDEGARLVAISAVQFQTGAAMPIEQIGALCAEAGTELFVDAIQAVGATPMDVEAAKIDYLASGSHKWLMGVEGAGFVYIRRDRIDALIPRLASWLSHEEGLAFLFEPDQLRYDRPIRREANFLEKGALNVLGYAALEASIDILMHLGIPAIYAHICAYNRRLASALHARVGWTSACARLGAPVHTILSYPMPEGVDLGAFGAALGDAGVSAATPDGHLRFAPHWPNDPDREIEGVCAAVEAALTATQSP